MPYRFVQPGERNATKVPSELTAQEVREILAMARAAATPEQIEEERLRLLDILEHPEKGLPMAQVLEDLKKKA